MFIQSYPQYGLGSWLKKNASWLVPVGAIGATLLTGGLAAPAAGAALTGTAGIGAAGAAGAGAGLAGVGAGLAGMAGLGAATGAAGAGLAGTLGTAATAGSIGSAIGNPISQNYQMDEAQKAQAAQAKQMQLQQDRSAAMNSLNNQLPKYGSVFKNGGFIPSYNNGGPISQEPVTGGLFSGMPLVQDPLENASALYKLRQNAPSMGLTVGDPAQLVPGSDIEKNIRASYQYPFSAYSTVTDKSGSISYVPVLNSPEHQKLVEERGLRSRTIKANGGYLEGARKLPGMTYYANGGTHQQNPLGGIPLGNNGSVEQGEFRYGDYIFSNRF